MVSSSTHSAAVAATPSIAGRARELADIDAVLESARNGQCRVVLLSGEPGIGKSRILLHAADRARALDFLVLRGNCYEDAEMAPYGPFVEILRDLVRQLPDVLVRFSGQEDGQVLAALAPELQRGDRGSESLSLSEVEQRQRLFDAYGRLLATVGAERPIALIVDDLHWSDAPSADLLRHLTRALRHSSAAVFCAYRDTDLDQGDPFERVLIDLNRENLARRVPLRRLDTAATAEIIARLLDTRRERVALSAVDSIQRESEGVPFFVEELTLHLREEGFLKPMPSGVWDLDRVSDSFVPQSIRSVISRRLARLDPATSDVLAIASVSGREFAASIVAEVAGRRSMADTELVTAALTQAIERRLLVERVETCAFAHEQIREVLYQSLSPIRRRQLHQLTAEAIERRSRDDARAASRLAYHYSHGDDLERALSFTVKAAEEASRAHALADATRHFDDALDILDVVGGSDSDQQRFDILHARDVVLAAAGANSERSAGIQAMLDVALRLDERECVHAHIRASLFSIFVNDSDAALEHAREAVSFAGDPATPDRLEAMLTLGQAIVMRPMGEPSPLVRNPPQVGEAEAIFRDAFDIAVSLRDTVAQARIAQELGVLAWAVAGNDELTRQERSREWLMRALEGFRSVGDRKGEVTSLIALAYRRNVSSSIQSKDPRDSYVSFLEEIRRLRATEHRLSRASERPRMDALALLSIELYCRSNGWYEVALQRASQALALAEEARDLRLTLMARIALSETERLLGRVPRAIEHAERVVDAINADGQQRTLMQQRDAAEFALAAAHALAGNAERAIGAVEECLERASTAGLPVRLAEALVARAEVAETIGEREVASQAARRALQVSIGLAGGITWDIRAELILARLALGDGDSSLALGHVSAAAGRLAQRGLSLIALHIAVELARGRALRAAGFDDDARESLTSANQRVMRIAERISDPALRETFLTRSPIARDVIAAVDEVGLPATPSLDGASDSDPQIPLTKRELEVLRQVAAGLSNREIADRLFISEKTVARHLTNIFTKLDVESRTQAAAWAFRQGIA